ncbi:MAG: hypothetical protein ACI8UO_003076 [Verrucomicrobiales bacterium]|jgi:hypothetical protein
MSLRLEMLQVSRLAPSILGDAAGLVEELVRGAQLDDGGFPDRDGDSDLYYTSFAIDTLTALQAELPEDRLIPYLKQFGDGEHLDFVHRCCLARCWSAVSSAKPDNATRDRILERIEAFRTPEGGYDQKPNSNHGSAYGCLLAYGAYADHRREPPNPLGILTCLDALKCDGGGWVNDKIIPIGNGPATAAAVTVCRNFRHPLPPNTADFLLSLFHPQGGFLPFPDAPMPDLLSTAVTLHALDGLQIPFGKIKEPCLDFVDSLWTAAGGFHGNWSDDDLDLEYTYYGLLALGHLAL